MAERIITYAEALKEATIQEMERDPSVFILGLTVTDFDGMYGTTLGLEEQFGSDRVVESPLSEDAMTGVAVGAALAGMRPIHLHQRMDFLLLAMNQIVNVAAKSSYMYGGAVSIPIVIRSVIGRSWGQGPQHSQGLQSFFMHIPGLKVVAPSTPYDAKGCMLASIRDNNPVIFVEHRMVHKLTGDVPEADYTVPFGKARILAEGSDITLVGISYMAVECMRAKEKLAEAGISAEVIDPISLQPLDIETILKSAAKTGKLIVVDAAWTSCGASAEIMAQVIENLQGSQHVQVRRIGFEPVTCPTTKNLEDLFYPDSNKIATVAHSMLENSNIPWTPSKGEAPEVAEFRGPF